MVILALLLFTPVAGAQSSDSTRLLSHFSGAVTVTNNGISLIPTFSLGDPAAIFNLNMGRRKLSFEPELRFALEGRPWSFLFWWRYQAVETEKFHLRVGLHPALNFRRQSVELNGETRTATITRRYFAWELAPNYFVGKNISVGMYYLYSRGLDQGTTKSNHFVTVNAGFHHISLPADLFLRIVPQVYYLKLDRDDGFYATATITLAHRTIPFSLQSIMNKIIDTNVPGSKDFSWNLSLIYSFSNNYVKQ